MIADWLMKNYYARYKGNRMDIVPTRQQINQAILSHPEKIIVVRDGGIKGIAFFFTLSDETYAKLEALDIKEIEVLRQLAQEDGRNIHFVLLATDGFKTTRIGLRRVIKNLRPKTVSWWSPDFKKLNRYVVEV